MSESLSYIQTPQARITLKTYKVIFMRISAVLCLPYPHFPANLCPVGRTLPPVRGGHLVNLSEVRKLVLGINNYIVGGAAHGI